MKKKTHLFGTHAQFSCHYSPSRTKRSLWARFREFDRKGPFIKRVDGWRAWTTGGYLFDKRIFWTAFIVLIVHLLLVFSWAQKEGFGAVTYWVSCPEDATGPCENPFFRSCDPDKCGPLAAIEYVPRGTSLGKDPRDLVRKTDGVQSAAVVYFVLALLANHFIHNKKFEFEI